MERNTSLPAVSMPQYKDIICNSITNSILEGYTRYFNTDDDVRDERVKAIEFFNSLLKECKAIVAGGYLLHSIQHNNPNNPDNFDTTKYPDIDIYVPCKNLSKFNKTMVKLLNVSAYNQHHATFYCMSFLRKNGIRTVQGLYTFNPINMRPIHLADIMAVRNSRSPLDVVKNFDLTFCQIWYDGDNLMATHPDHVINKTGLLQKDYALLYIKGNRFLIRRIRKYRYKGYTINLEPFVINISDVGTVGVGGSNCIDKPIKDEAYFKKWISRALFRFCIFGQYKAVSPKVFEAIPLNNELNFNWRYRDISDEEISRPVVDMKPLDYTDGYDTEDYDITSPETYYPILDNFYKNGNENQVESPYRDIENERKFWFITNNLLKTFYSNKRDIIPLHQEAYNTEDDIVYHIYHTLKSSNFNTYHETLHKYTQRNGVDAITLLDEPVYDIHKHTLDEGIGKEGIKLHLNQYMNYNDKENLPCYVNGCTNILSLNEIRMMVDYNYYLQFISNAQFLQPDNLLRNEGPWDVNEEGNEKRLDVIQILRNYKSSTDTWGNIYHTVMCPFCLVFIARNQGCAYVHHQIGEGSNANSPYCNPKNVIKEIYDKYKRRFGLRFEVCIECGRPCSNHKHIDLNDPPGYERQRVTQLGMPDYGVCAGGGRREGIARVIAVHNTIRNNPGMNPIELRRLAGLAAEDSADDARLLEKADEILAKDKNTRVIEDLNMEQNLRLGGGKIRIGKISSYGYESYKNIIKKTRKSSVKKTKKTRKN
jgi:hypothetical protein